MGSWNLTEQGWGGSGIRFVLAMLSWRRSLDALGAFREAVGGGARPRLDTSVMNTRAVFQGPGTWENREQEEGTQGV